MVLEGFLSVGGIIGTLINAIIAFIVIMLVNKIVAHNFDVKRVFILAIIALFVIPVISLYALSYANIGIPYIGTFIIPLIFWIILGEILLKGAGVMTKLKVIVIAFIVYELLTIFLTPYLFAAIP